MSLGDRFLPTVEQAVVIVSTGGVSNEELLFPCDKNKNSL